MSYEKWVSLAKGLAISGGATMCAYAVAWFTANDIGVMGPFLILVLSNVGSVLNQLAKKA